MVNGRGTPVGPDDALWQNTPAIRSSPPSFIWRWWNPFWGHFGWTQTGQRKLGGLVGPDLSRPPPIDRPRWLFC